MKLFILMILLILSTACGKQVNTKNPNPNGNEPKSNPGVVVNDSNWLIVNFSKDKELHGSCIKMNENVTLELPALIDVYNENTVVANNLKIVVKDSFGNKVNVNSCDYLANTYSLNDSSNCNKEIGVSYNYEVCFEGNYSTIENVEFNKIY